MTTIYYNSHAPDDVYAMIRAAMPADAELLTLNSDSDAERLQKIRHADIVIAASAPLTANLIDAARKLRLVCHQGVGYHDTVDWQALRQRGIPLVLTPEGTATGVAEHAVMLMLATYKRLSFADAELRAGRFHINALRPVSRELAGKTVGYIGMGRIGQALVKRLHAFETKGLYYDLLETVAPAQAAQLDLRRVAKLDELLIAADIVTVHVPLTQQTRHMIDARALSLMKPDAILINTARGPIVDEQALCTALTEGALLAAGLDVYEREPLPAASPLMALPNVVLTPHIAAGTADAFHTKMKAVFANVQRFRRGEALHNLVTFETESAVGHR